jgi:hypothetical protein
MGPCVDALATRRGASHSGDMSAVFVALFGMKNAADCSTTASIVERFQVDGFAVIPNVVPLFIIERCHREALATFNECQKHIDMRPLVLGIGKQGGFEEIVQRQRSSCQLKDDSVMATKLTHSRLSQTVYFV